MVSPLFNSMEAEILALRRLSESFDSIFTSNYNSFADAKITVADGREFAVHRCILSARSPFFRTLFSADETRVNLEMKDLGKDFEVSFDALDTVLVYLYSGRLSWLRCVCVDGECEHVACRPAVDFVVEVLYASSVFEITELVNLCQRHLLDILDKIAADDILWVLSQANICVKECDRLLTRCTENIARSDVDIITLYITLPDPIVKRIIDFRKELGFHGPESSGFPDKHLIRIYRALDSADLESVRMLLKDDACALHHAVAYCDTKTTMKLLDLAIDDVNCKNPRGYTLLHIAAMRKEPKIIVSLLTKGAQPGALTSDGRKALKILKRLTRAADYYKSTERGTASPKDRLCIEILERAERRPPLLGEASASRAKSLYDLRMMLLYLEDRVAMAKRFYPTEAEVAMDVAQVDDTPEFALPSTNSTSMAGAKRKTVDLNDATFTIKDEHINRIRVLCKTVELGELFFPRCSEVLNDILHNNELSELAFMQNGTEEVRELKKQRYVQTQEAITEALHEDTRDNDELSELHNNAIHDGLSALMQNGTEVERQFRSDEPWYTELEDIDLAFWEETRDLEFWMPNGKVTLKK